MFRPSSGVPLQGQTGRCGEGRRHSIQGESRRLPATSATYELERASTRGRGLARGDASTRGIRTVGIPESASTPDQRLAGRANRRAAALIDADQEDVTAMIAAQEVTGRGAR